MSSMSPSKRGRRRQSPSPRGAGQTGTTRLCHVLHLEDVFIGQAHTLRRVIAVNGVPLKAVVEIGVFQHQGENVPTAETLILHVAAIGDLLILDALQALLCGFAVDGCDLLIDSCSVGRVIFDLRHMEGKVVWEAVGSAAAFLAVKLNDGNLFLFFQAGAFLSPALQNSWSVPHHCSQVAAPAFHRRIAT